MSDYVKSRLAALGLGGSSGSSSGGQNKTTASKSSGKSSYVEQRLNALGLSPQGKGTIGDDRSMRQWFESAYNAIEEMNSYNEKNWDTYMPNYGGQTGAKLSQLLGEADSVSQYLQSRQRSEDTDGWNQALSEYRRVLSGLNDQNRQRSRFFGQWKDADEYGVAMQQDAWRKKYDGQSVEQLRSAADALEDGDEKSWLSQYADQTDYSNKLAYDVSAGQQELQQLQDKRKDMELKEKLLSEYVSSPLLMLTRGDQYRALKDEVLSFRASGGMSALEQEIQKVGDMNLAAKQIQDSARQQQEHAQWVTTVRDVKTVAQELERAKAQAEELKEKVSLDKDSIRTPMGGISMEAAQKLDQDEADYQATIDRIGELEKEYWWAQKQAYEKLSENKDFEEKSKYVSTRTSSNAWDLASGTTGFRDAEYDYINRNPVAVGRQTAIDQQSGAAAVGLDRSQLQSMTDDEIKTYNYLYATEGKQEAKKYLSFLQSNLNARQRTAYEDFVRQAASSGFLGGAAASAVSVMMAPMKGIGYIGQAADLLQDGSIDQNAGYNRYGYMSKAIRDQVVQNIENNPKWGKVGSFGYQLAMSMGDFLLNAKLSGGSSKVAGLLLGTGAAADTVIDAKDRGLSDNQAFALGTIAGIAEQLTEKYSLETLLDADLLKDSVSRYVRKNMLAEGSEEAASSVINLMADVVISQDKSQWMERMQQYQDMGYSKGEAFGKVLAEQAAAIGLDALGGVISGGVMGGGSALAFETDSHRLGAALRTRGIDSSTGTQLAQAGMEAQPGTAAREVSQQMQSKLDQGKELSKADIGRLAQANPELASQMVRQGSGTVRLATPQVNVSNTDKRWQQAQRLAGITGRNIVFYNGSKLENGYFDRNTGEIFVNANGGDPALQTFSHELTHSTEMADVYSDLQKVCFQKLRSLGEDISQMRRDKMAQYEQQGHPLSSEAEANQEIVAEFVSKYLLTDEQTIAEVVLDSPTIGQRILGWIDRVLARLGNESAQERVFLQNARSLYSKALEQSRNRPWQQKENVSESDTTQEADVQDPDLDTSIQEMTEAYERGDLTEDEYNAIVDNLREEFQRRAEGRQYSFAGEKAKTSDMDALARAKKMQQQGVANETIRQQTGWFQGSDGKWRWDIEDQVQNRYQNASLAQDGNVYTYEFLTSLPDMNAVTVVDVEDIRSTNGRIDTGKVIALGKKNALSVGTERGGEIYVKNRYTGRELAVTTASIRHGLNGTMNRLLTNARLGSVIGEIVQNAVPINALHNASDAADGTYAMAGYAVDSDGREFVAIITVEQRTGNVEGVDVYDVTHAVSGRQKRGGAPVDTKSQGINLSTHASDISIKDFLSVVKNVYQSVLSRDVLSNLGAERPLDGYYSDRVKFSLRNDGSNNQQNAEQAASEKDASKVRDGLNRKASDYLNGIEHRLQRQLGDQLGIPRYAQYDVVRPVIRDMADEFLETGAISDETLKKAFDTAYDQGKVMDREFYDQYKDVKDHLRTTAVTLSEQDRSNIPDFNLWRKSMFGSLRIANEGGLPVDTAYRELQEMAPELFPERITHPADQLQRMGEVAKSIRKVEKSLDEYYGPEAAEFRKWARNDFQVSVGDMIPMLRNVKRFAEQAKTENALPRLNNTQEAQQAFKDRKRANVEKENVRARHLLSRQDQKYVSDLLQGLITLDDLKGKDVNEAGIREVYEATKAYEDIDKQIRQYQAELRQNRQDEADKHLGSSLYWKDKKTGFSYMRETMRRNILDIVSNKEDAYALLRTYFEPVQVQEAARQRFLTEWRNKVRTLELSTKPAKGDEVSEAYAVQLYGEAMSSIEMIQESRGRVKERDGRDLDDWQGLILDLFQHNPSLDQAKIEKAVNEYRKMYDELFQMMNEVLVRNGYPPVEYRKGYFPHFQGEDDGVMVKFGRLLGINVMDDMLPTTINGLTHTFRPGKQWFGNALERTGYQTTYDAVEGFDRYIQGVSNVIYHTDNIQRLRALSRQIRYKSSDEGIREEARRIQEDVRWTEAEKEEKLDKLYADGKFALSHFITELDDYTNILAGKKSAADRGVERILGRKFYTWMKQLESQVGANMVGGNLASAFTNFIPLTQAWGQLDTETLLAGMRDALQGMNKTDGFVNMSDFLTSRRGSDKLTQTWIQKASAMAGLPMEMVDNFTSEAITRGAYYQNLKRGMSQEEALHQADIFAAAVIGDRSKGAMPTIFEMKNPVAKIFTQFQLEVNNQLSEVFKDLPRAAKEKAGREIVAMLFKYFVGAWLFNNLYELLIGRRPALDPINMVWEAVEDWQDDGMYEAGKNLVDKVTDTLPFVSGLVGGGRVPIASAIPDFGNIGRALTADPLTVDEETGEKTGMAFGRRVGILAEELVKPAMLVAFPFGGNQVMKAWKGVSTVLKGGSYSILDTGERELQYAVDADNPWEMFGKALMASVMGKSALSEARAWTEKGFKSFNAKQTALYEDLQEAGVGSKDAYDIIDSLRSAKKTETLSQKEVQLTVLDDSNLSDEAKAVVYYGVLATDMERELMDKLTDLGAEEATVGNVTRELYDIDQLPAEEKKPAQAKLLRDSQLTDEEKREIVATLMDTTELVNENGNPTEYAKFLTAADAGLSVDKYMTMREKGATLDSAFDFMDTGVPCDVAADIAIEMKALKPAAGYSSVSYLQRLQVVLDADLSERQKLEAFGAVGSLNDSTYDKIILGYGMGMDLQAYVDLRKALPRYDANGNGSYTSKETQAAIDGALFHLSNEEKAVLWQLQNKSWKPKKNPYSREIGSMVYNAMQSMSDAEQEEISVGDPYAMMRALGLLS